MRNQFCILTVVGVAAMGTLASGRAAAQCIGDLDGDNQVSIEEIQASIGSALSGCPELPPSCPVDFSTDNTGGQAQLCVYVGSWNAVCPSPSLGIAFESDGTSLRLLLVRPDFVIRAEVISATQASIVAWAATLTPTEADFKPLSGAITLEPPGNRLVIDPDTQPFTVGGCPFDRYEGNILQVLGSPPESATSTDATARSSRFPASLMPLPAWP